MFSVEQDNPHLINAGYEVHYNEKNYSGLIYHFYPNGQLSFFSFVWKGKRISSEYSWHENGNLEIERQYKNGIAHGDWKQWYENGKVRRIGHYTNGVVDGEGWAWHPSGLVSDYNLYKNGVEITHKSWLFDGKPFYNYLYQNGKKIGLKGGNFCKISKLTSK